MVENYADAQLIGLKAGLLATGAIALLSLPFTRHLPGGTPAAPQAVPAQPGVPAAKHKEELATANEAVDGN